MRVPAFVACGLLEAAGDAPEESPMTQRPRALDDGEPDLATPPSPLSRRAILVAAGAALAPSLAAAAIAGFFVAGIGGRLAMFILRLTSGDRVVGLESDDGFIIGRFTTDTFGLVLALTVGASIVAGPAYTIARLWFPQRWRPLVFASFLGVLGGAGLVHTDGVDFTVLSPRVLAVALFVAIPAAFGAVLEPLHELARRQTQRLPGGAFLVIGILAMGAPIVIGLDLPGIALAALGWGAVLLGQGERIGQVLRSRPLAWAGWAGMVVVSAFAARDLASDVTALF